MANRLKKRHDEILDKEPEHLEKINKVLVFPQNRSVTLKRIMLEKEIVPTFLGGVRGMFKKNAVYNITNKMSFGCSSVTQTFVLGKIDKYTYPEDVLDLDNKNI